MSKWILLLFGLSILPSNGFAQFDVPPENVGGKSEGKRILSEAFCAENVSSKNRVPGKIILKFIINKDGSTDSLSFVKTINSEVDKEIQRVFPVIQWLPGLIDKEPVSAWHLFEFRLNKKFYENSDLCTDEDFGQIYPFVELSEKPEFLWGDFNKWVYNHLEYPEVALKKGIDGAVLTRFVVEKNGGLSNLGIARSVGGGCDEEALRVIKLSKWQAGRKDGKKVRTQIYYQITFKTRQSDFESIHSGDMIKGQ